jgi:hypothetical protein
VKLLLFGAFLANTLGIFFNLLFLHIYFKKELKNES